MSQRATASIVLFALNMVLLQRCVPQVRGYQSPILLGTKLLRRRHGPVASSYLTGTHDLDSRQRYLCMRRELFCGDGSDKDGEIDEFEQCWMTTSEMVNANTETNRGDAKKRMDTILQGLNSPAPQSYYILQRTMKELSKSDTEHFEETVKECSYLIKPGWQLVVQDPRRHGDVSTMMMTTTTTTSTTTTTAAIPPLQWDLVPIGSATESIKHSDAIIVTEGSGGPNACQLSNQALSIVSKAADAQQPIDTQAVDELVNAMERRLRLTLGTDIRGRTSADMAFNLCLAGIDNDFLYRSLTKVAKLEMERVGQRPSRRARDVLHVVEKLAASGIRGEKVKEVYELAAKSLQAKDQYPEVVKQLLSSSPDSLDLLSPRPLLWLWRYSSRLQKPVVKEASSSSSSSSPSSLPHNDDNRSPWWKKFEDPSRPLVVDVGCGLGVSLLGLASSSSSSLSSSSSSCAEKNDAVSSEIPLDWSQCNYVGGDLNEATVRFATSIAQRWDISNKLQYLQLSADHLLNDVVQNYPGPVSLIMIQFPSPWRLQKKKKNRGGGGASGGGSGGGGNSQLPSGPDDENFMVSKALMGKIATILQTQRKNSKDNDGNDCYFLLQTNCEDVALVLRDRAKECGLTLVPCLYPVTAGPTTNSTTTTGGGCRIPERTVEWLKLCRAEGKDNPERAVGPEWSRVSLLPSRCATETEVACTIQGSSPIHRCLFKVEQ